MKRSKNITVRPKGAADFVAQTGIDTFAGSGWQPSRQIPGTKSTGS